MQEKKTTPDKVLTWPPFLFLMLLAFALSGCHYSPKMQVAVHEANKKCPVEMGSFGTATSIDYDDGMVVFNVDLKDGTADLSQVNRTLSSGLLVTNLKRMKPEFIDLLLSTETGLSFHVKSTDGAQATTIDIPLEEIKRIIRQSGKPGKDINIQTLKLFNRQSQSELPLKVAEGITMTHVAIEGSNEIYQYEVDGGIFDIKTLQENAKRLKDHPEEMLNIKDANIQILVSLLCDLNMGLGYRYNVKGSDQPLEIIYTPEQLHQLIP